MINDLSRYDRELLKDLVFLRIHFLKTEQRRAEHDALESEANSYNSLIATYERILSKLAEGE